MVHDVLQLGVATFSCMSCWEWFFVTFSRGGPEVSTLVVRSQDFRDE